MSTPTTSTGPTPPGPTSNPVPLRGWFTSIIDWIKALSPAGASTYDTGWVPILSGAVTVSARRVGRTVTVVASGGQSIPPMGKVIVSAGNLIPATMRPDKIVFGVCELRWLGNGVGVMSVDSGGTIWLWNPTSLANGDWSGSVTYVM